MKTFSTLLIASALLVSASGPSALAQTQTPPVAAAPVQPRPQPQVTFSPSGRALTEISVSGAGGTGARITIEYGQPHAGGREVFGALVPLDSVWRAGANRATQLTTDVTLVIGGTRLAPGNYTLALWASKAEPKLVINSRTRQWGIPYSPVGEIARVPMRARTLAEPVETFTIALVPNAMRPGAGAPTAPGTGTLVMTWGTMQFSVDFSAQP